MENVPEKIYLQVGDEDGIENVDFKELAEVSWCQDQIFDTDIEYTLKQSWQSFGSFDMEPNEGWCWIVYKGRVVESYRDHNGKMFFYPKSANCYMREIITHAQPMIKPEFAA